MLNKKLVIAALLAAADVSANTAATSGGTASGTGKTGTTAKPTAGATTKPATKPADPNAGKLPEEVRAAWKAADGKAILCDQGNSAMWKAAEKSWTDLTAAKKAADDALKTAKSEYDALKGKLDEATKAKKTHETANATYLANYAATKKVFDQLTTDAQGGGAAATLVTSTKKAYDAEVLKTTTAQNAVATQRGRLETLLTLKQANVAEEAAWATRITALSTAKATADTLVTTNTTDLAEMKAVGASRSYLFDILRLFDTANYDTSCVPGLCLYLEVAGTKSASKSEWAWNDQAATCKIQNTNKNCKVKGLVDLKSTIATKLGAARVVGGSPSNPTGAYLTLENADYTYSSGDSNLKKATTAYATWQAAAMLAQSLNVACWKVDGSAQYDYCGATKADATARVGCASTFAGQTACKRHNPLMDKFDTTVAPTAGYKFTQADLNTATTTAKGDFGSSTADKADANLTTNCVLVGGKCTVTNLIPVKAKAQISLWLHHWSNVQFLVTYNAYIAKYGDFPNKASDSDFATTTDIGKLEVTLSDNTKAAAKAKGDLEWAQDQQTAQGAGDAAVDVDIGRARTLLADLVADVAVAARAEEGGATKKAWQAAVAAEAKITKAKADLGAASKTSPTVVAATGETAVWEAAQEVKASIDKQTAFHTARVLWANDNLAPATAKWQAATAALNGSAAKNANGTDVTMNGQPMLTGGLVKDLAAAKAAMDAAKDACKVAAFDVAQAARVAKAKLASERATKVAAVKKEYAAKAKFPTDGGVGSLCNAPKGSPDGDRVKECKEEQGGSALCCGAAQRYLKNGTRLTIETCQKDLTAVYTYYPPLGADDIEMPLGETWRFQCISGAQKLAAVAAAVLAAGAMIA